MCNLLQGRPRFDLKGNPIGDPMEQLDMVNSAIFSPDGTTVLTRSGDHYSTRLRNVPMALDDFLESDRIKPLSDKQKEQYKIDQ